VSNLIDCSTHGEQEKTYVCNHLADGSAGLGFNRGEPTEENPFPDAWCDECNLIYEANDGWGDATEGLITIRLLCSGCYEKARIRNTRTEVTFEDLSDFRWKCYSCEEWHTGPCLDFSYDVPIYWEKENDLVYQALDINHLPETYLDDDFCITEGSYFVRGLIELPIIGTAELFRWGVWGSLSKDSFQKLVSHFDDPDRVSMESMFSWLSNNIADYEETLNLKMYAHIREPGQRPSFELEPTEHQLSQEQRHGITAERVKEIMKKRLKETE